MPLFTVTNRTASDVVLPITPAIKLSKGESREIAVPAAVMEDPTLTRMVSRGVISVTAAEDPNVSDAIEVPTLSISGTGGGITGAIKLGNPDLLGEATVDLWASSGTGDDDSGDGTFLSPFASIQRAMDEIPDGFDGFARIFCTSGSYAAPVFRRVLGTNGFLLILANRDSPVVTYGTAPTFTLDTNKTSQYTATVAAHVGFDDVTHWLLADFGGGFLWGYNLLDSASGEIKATAGLGGAPTVVTGVHAFDTNLTVGVSGSFGAFSTSAAGNIVFIGFNLNGTTGTFSGAKLQGCKISMTGLTITDAAVEDCIFPNTVSITESVSLIGCHFKGLVNNRGGNSRFNVCLFDSGARLQSVATTPIGASLPLYDIQKSDFEGTGAQCVTLRGPASSLGIRGDIYCASTRTQFILSQQGGDIVFSAGSIRPTSGCTGDGVVLREGTHCVGLESYMGAAFTAGGNEVVVGGLAGQTFAALPTTDTTELVRAT